MKLREEKARATQEEEENVRQQLLNKFAEDDRIEQMNDHKRRMKVEEHKREAQRLMELRRDMYEKEREQERASHAALRDQEAQRQIVIEEERRRLLQDHASDLLD